MTRKPKQLKPALEEYTETIHKNIFAGRDGLGLYLRDPANYGPERVLSYSSEYVVINDLYPKSSVHLLVLSRDSEKNCLHPFEAFKDKAFLEAMQSEVQKVRDIAASELRRKYGAFSLSDKARSEAINIDPPLLPTELPAGRDWGKDILSGVHAHPSMGHLHVHVLSVDRSSKCLRHRKHYNSFNTPFLVPLEDFPLAPDDPRWHPGEQAYLKSDLICWKCGDNYGKAFTAFKRHLDVEFESWKRL